MIGVVRRFLIHVRYIGGFMICMLGCAIEGLGLTVTKLGRWIASRG